MGAQDKDALRQQAWDRHLMAAGTASIFERRSARLRSRLKLLTFASLGVPTLVGALVLGYGAGVKYLTALVAIGAGLGVAQIIVSLWAVVAGWVDGYERSTRSVVENHDLAQAFESFARHPPADTKAARNDLAVLIARDDSRRGQDYLLAPTDAEKRMGMRAALRRLGRPCAGCNVIPQDMRPSECGVCGNF